MYRILRNNKEQGPYSLDELVQLSLRPYDLIWVEGKSASWRYPTEIEELKPYIPGLVSETTSPQTLPQTSLQVVVPIDKTLAEPIIAHEEEELNAAMLEQKANAIYQRIQAYNAKSEQEAKDVQTKYARSLEDLKQDYAEWLHGKKNRRREVSSNKGWVAFGAVSAAFIIFVLAGKNKDMVWPVYRQKDIAANKPLPSEPRQGKQSPATIVTENATSQQLSEGQKVTVEAFIDSMRNVLRKKDLVSNVPKKVEKPSKKNTNNQIAVHPVQSITLPVEKKVNFPVIKAADLDARYIPGENSSRIKEVHVTVHNTGTVPLKQVTVLVFYYKKGERLLDKETLYFSNIRPGNSYTVSKPGNRKAVFARFELGELTADN
jgi:hypothetical protein